MDAGYCFQSILSSSYTQARGGQLSTSMTTPGALQELFSSLWDDDEDSDDNEDYSTDEDESKVNSEEAKLKRKLVKLIKTVANKTIELLEEFIEYLLELLGIKAFSFAESDLEPEDI